jgi:hypothetical protein
MILIDPFTIFLDASGNRESNSNRAAIEEELE